MRKDEIPSIIVVIICCCIVITGVSVGKLSYDFKEMNSLVGSVLVSYISGLALRKITLYVVSDIVLLTSIYIALAIVVTAASLVLATFGMPYADEIFAVADKNLFDGFNFPEMVFMLEPYKRSLLILAYVYASLTWQPVLLIIFLCCQKKGSVAWRFMTAWSFALFACLAITPFYPALGPYYHFGIAHNVVPNVRVNAAWDTPVLMEGIRNGGIRLLTPKTLEGVITMPSFHAAGAVMLAWGFWRISLLRWPAIGLNVLMLASAIPIGGHYIVDVVAGCGVAGLGIGISGNFHPNA